MSLKIENENIKNHKKPSASTILTGAAAGYVVNNTVATIPKKLVSPLLMQNMIKINDGLTKDEFSQLQKGIKGAFDKSNLASCGVGILRASEETSAEVASAMAKEFNKGPFKLIPKQIKDFMGSIMGSIIEEGKNACYADSVKKIIIPKEKLNLSFFHEAGHAINANMSVLGKTLQKSRMLGLLAVPIMFISLFKNKKQEGEKPKNSLDKATDFVKNNAGKLTFLAITPTLLEEGMATVKGNKLAKEFLSSNLAKKVTKTNRLGYITYMLMALGFSAGIYLANKVRDRVVSSNEKQIITNTANNVKDIKTSKND